MKGYTEYRIRRFLREHEDLFIGMFCVIVLFMWVRLMTGGMW